MYEIFGNSEAVTVRKNNNTLKPHLGISIPIKGESNQKLRSLSVGNSKIVLGDVSNKVKNTLAVDVQPHLRSLSPTKLIKKTLFSEELAHSDCTAKASGVRNNKREKSPGKVKSTPKPTAKSATLAAAKVQIFVDDWNDGTSDLDEVFLPNQDELDRCDLEASPQKIYGYCDGYETPDDDVGGWLLEPIWDDKKDIGRIIDLDPRPEKEPDLPETKPIRVSSPTDETNFDNLFEMDEPCYPEPLVDVPMADLEW